LSNGEEGGRIRKALRARATNLTLGVAAAQASGQRSVYEPPKRGRDLFGGIDTAQAKSSGRGRHRDDRGPGEMSRDSDGHDLGSHASERQEAPELERGDQLACFTLVGNGGPELLKARNGSRAWDPTGQRFSAALADRLRSGARPGAHSASGRRKETDRKRERAD